MDDATRLAIRVTDAARSRALVEQNYEILDALLHDDLVHIHTSGVLESKAQFLDTVRNRFRFLKVDRRNYELRLAGTAVIAVGELDQRIKVQATGEEVDMEMITTQVWVCTPADWKQIHYHAALRKR